MKIIICVMLLVTFICSAQNNTFENWTENEKSQYLKLHELARYVSGKQKAEILKDTLFDKFVYFDYVINDTDVERRERRYAIFDTVFYRFRKIIDTISISNFEAKPIRFYKDHEIYKPFDEEIAKEAITGDKMYTQSSNVFAYYRKNEPENPLGTLLFEPETSKLIAWIMIDQGGYMYFLIFNLL